MCHDSQFLTTLGKEFSLWLRRNLKYNTIQYKRKIIIKEVEKERGEKREFTLKNRVNPLHLLSHNNNRLVRFRQYSTWIKAV